jgi:hypothetical protein
MVMFAALMLAGALLPNIEIGQNLSPPAQIAGPWEALVAPDEIAGFSLQVVANANEKVRSLRVATYVRKNGKTMSTWWNSGDSGEFVLRTGRLQFHQRRTENSGFDVALDLTYDPVDMTWTGSFQDPFFSGHVTLRRPALGNALLAPTGTWRRYSSVTIWPAQRVQTYGCLNIGLGQDGTLVLWAESHNIFLGDAKAVEPVFGDSYGELYDDAPATTYVDQWSFVAGTIMGGDRITGALSSDGSSFGGYSEHFGNGIVDPSHPRRAFAWVRMLDLQCRP